jgi:glycosyltransferase involved in cell wall biosynthesis
MKIIEILPTLEIGGVESHVIELAREFAGRGHCVLVVSGGGRLESGLPSGTDHRTLPVYKKNIYSPFYCAHKIASWIKAEGYDILHAHSRVPAWVAYLAARSSGVPYVLTAHSDYTNKRKWVYMPYRAADRVIAVSDTVREKMRDCFSGNVTVVANGMDEPSHAWSGPAGEKVKFLYVGRLTQLKGLESLFNALPQEEGWELDILGDGPFEDELRRIADERGIADRIKFHGYSDRVDEFMAKSSCLLFPSRSEGYGLVAARAAQIGLPALMSDIPSIAELAGTREGLLPPDDVEAWSKAIKEFIATGRATASIPTDNVQTLKQMADSVEKIYMEVLRKRGKAL